MIVEIRDDFDIEKIEKSGQCFRAVPVLSYHRFIIGENIIYIRKKDNSHYEVSCTEEEWKKIWISYFDLERDYASICNDIIERFPEDLYLKDAIAYGKGIRILKQDPFEMLISFIISQRKSIPSIQKSIEAICKRYGRKIKTPYEEISLFPKVDELSKASLEELTTCSLGYRVPYIMDAVQKVANGSLALDNISKMPNEQLLDTLKEVKGVGDKVANCISLFAYSRLDQAPIDTWIKKTIDEVYHGHNPFPDYGRYRGLMQQYLFFYSRTYGNALSAK